MYPRYRATWAARLLHARTLRLKRGRVATLRGGLAYGHLPCWRCAWLLRAPSASDLRHSYTRHHYKTVTLTQTRAFTRTRARTRAPTPPHAPAPTRPTRCRHHPPTAHARYTRTPLPAAFHASNHYRHPAPLRWAVACRVANMGGTKRRFGLADICVATVGRTDRRDGDVTLLLAATPSPLP